MKLDFLCDKTHWNRGFTCVLAGPAHLDRMLLAMRGMDARRAGLVRGR
jgi:hypothetical protein